MFLQDPQSQQTKFTVSDVVNLVYLACHIWRLPVELLWRHKFGSRYIDIFLLPAAVWPMLFASFVAPQFDATWTVWGFWLIVTLGVYHAIVARRLDRRGVLRHSQYNGYPHLCRLFPNHETACKTRGEMLLTMMISLPAVAISPSLMLFLWGSCIAAVIKYAISEIYLQNLMTDLRDARLEQQALSDRMSNEL